MTERTDGTDEQDTTDEAQSPHGGKIHAFAPRAGENSDGRETPFTPCHRGVTEDDDPDDPDVDIDVDSGLSVPLSAGLLPLGVVVAAIQTPLAVSVLGLALIVVGGMSLSASRGGEYGA